MNMSSKEISFLLKLKQIQLWKGKIDRKICYNWDS